VGIMAVIMGIMAVGTLGVIMGIMEVTITVAVHFEAAASTAAATIAAASVAAD
jgi:hypothetical protein